MIDKKYKDLQLVETSITWQGEGDDAGKLIFLLRFLRCNVKCKFCDTLDRIESCPVKRYTFKQLTDIGEKANHNYVITGGEPTLYNDQILDFIEYLQNNIPHYTVGFETNGFKMIELYNNIIKYIPGAIDHIKFSFSPKFLNTKNTKDLITKICKNIPWDKFIIKMVYEEGKEDELETIVHLIRACNDKIMIFLMPESIIGTETILRMTKLLPLAKKLKCNISSRLHLIHNFY